VGVTEIFLEVGLKAMNLGFIADTTINNDLIMTFLSCVR
jgi:hypothetical protein